MDAKKIQEIADQLKQTLRLNDDQRLLIFLELMTAYNLGADSIIRQVKEDQ
jgi:hypothetical protein